MVTNPERPLQSLSKTPHPNTQDRPLRRAVNTNRRGSSPGGGGNDLAQSVSLGKLSIEPESRKEARG
jgi:hypothetical protein